MLEEASLAGVPLEQRLAGVRDAILAEPQLDVDQRMTLLHLALIPPRDVFLVTAAGDPVEDRRIAVELHAAGVRPSEIARRLNRSHSTVHYWVSPAGRAVRQPRGRFDAESQALHDAREAKDPSKRELAWKANVSLTTLRV